MDKKPQLSDTEWELMKVLWECTPAPVNEIAAKVADTQPWHPKTVRTMLMRLHKKNILKQTKVGNVYHYSPLYTREECASQATESFLDRVFDGALTPMIAHFSKKKRLTIEEKRALEKLLHDSDDSEDE
jgi:BlaI family transcriptional regulator, penicillinase repressor